MYVVINLSNISKYLQARNTSSSSSNAVRTAPFATMPLSAPAPVPRSAALPGDTIAAKDACEMMLCSTKQRKRKGVPYCGTCRKFMEETVKWYYDLFKTHPAKEKDKFVEAVRGQRYNCKQDRTEGMPCGCKACHSLRRFQEMYPKCKANLHEFKRRSYLFVEPTATPTTPWEEPDIKKVKTEKSEKTSLLPPVIGLDNNLRSELDATKTSKRRRRGSFGQILAPATHQASPSVSASAGHLTSTVDFTGHQVHDTGTAMAASQSLRQSVRSTVTPNHLITTSINFPDPPSQPPNAPMHHAHGHTHTHTHDNEAHPTHPTIPGLHGPVPLGAGMGDFTEHQHSFSTSPNNIQHLQQQQQHLPPGHGHRRAMGGMGGVGGVGTIGGVGDVEDVDGLATRTAGDHQVRHTIAPLFQKWRQKTKMCFESRIHFNPDFIYDLVTGARQPSRRAF